MCVCVCMYVQGQVAKAGKETSVRELQEVDNRWWGGGKGVRTAAQLREWLA